MMKIKEGLEGGITDDFWNDLKSGNFGPEDILEEPNDIVLVRGAIDVLRAFQNSCENGIEEFYC